MRWLTAVVFIVLIAGCGGSDDAIGTEAETSAGTSTSTAAETQAEAATRRPPRTFDELMARLPPFDVPASPDVKAFRRAAMTSFLDRAHGKSVLPPAKLPARPTGEQYPISSEDFRGDPPPTEYEVEPGSTCERILTADQQGPVTLIVPPPPGVMARIEDKPFKLGTGTFDGSVVVEWSLGTVHGDCPPSELILSYPTITAFTIHEPVHSTSGVARMPLLDIAPRPMLLRATAVSVDGHHSRQVAVLLR